MRISEEIKRIRVEGLLSQEAFAKELGVSFTTVNRWEAGKAKPTYKTLKLIKEFCEKNNIDVDINKMIPEEHVND